MGIHEMKLSAAGESRGSGRCFPSANSRVSKRKREKNIRVAERVMIEEVARSGAEVAHVEGPPFEGNRESEFTLLVALAMQRHKTLAPGDHALIPGECRIVDGYQRRGLVIATVESAQDPVQMRNLNGCADAG